MKVTLELVGTDKEKEQKTLSIQKADIENKNITLSLAYQEIVLSIDDLEKAIKYIKGVSNEKI